MNSLTWALYLLDIVGQFKGVLIIAACCVALPVAVCLVGYAMAWADNGAEDWNFNWCLLSKAGGVFLLLCLVSMAIPSRNTRYAMLASEVAYRVKDTEEVKGISHDALAAVRAWINKQLTEEEKK